MAPFATGDASARRPSGALNQVIASESTSTVRAPNMTSAIGEQGSEPDRLAVVEH